MRMWRTRVLGTVVLVSACGLAACESSRRAAPPPDVRRPQIKSETELAAERAERIETGQIVPTSSPAIATLERASNAARRPPPVQPQPGDISGDILIVNDAAVSVAEVLYPLRDEIRALRRSRTRAGFAEEVRRVIRRQAQQEIGSILIYAEAKASLDEQERKMLDAAVDKEIDNLSARDFGASATRFDAYLKEHGLTRELYRENLRRSMVVRQYTREKLMPQIQVRRDELLSYYRANLPRYSTGEARELLLLEVPFEKFLPEGRTWDRAGSPERAQAKLRALRRVREAHAALAERSFEDVAREYSLGLHADDGGSWGLLGRPLQPPYDATSKLIFEHEESWTSEPLETETGWCIVQCGRVEPAAQRPFAEVQEEIRAELMERRFHKLSADYVIRLAEKATISSLDSFVTAAVLRADKLTAAAAKP